MAQHKKLVPQSCTAPSPVAVAFLALLLPVLLLPASALAQDDSTGDSSWLDAADSTATTAQTASEEKSIGQALLFQGIQVDWSGYGDLILDFEPEEYLGFDNWHFNPIMNVRMGDKIRAEAEFEYEHSGTEIKLEYAYVDYAPLTAAVFRAGVFLVPIGEFNDNMHPSFRWTQVDRPGMFTDVLPAVWSDVGVMFYGRAPVGDDGNVSYSAYVVNGMGGATLDLTADEAIRPMHDITSENNTDKGIGGRLRFRALQSNSVGKVGLTLSAYTGALLEDNASRFTANDVAFSLGLGPVTLLGEGAITFLDQGSSAGAGEYFQAGTYVQARTDIGKFTPSVRYDFVDGHLSTKQAVVGTLLWHTALFWSLRAEVGVPIDMPGEPLELDAMSSFFF